jgi:hypothetical protein
MIPLRFFVYFAAWIFDHLLHTSLVELEFGDTPFFVLEILEMFWWRELLRSWNSHARLSNWSRDIKKYLVPQ